MSLEHAHQILNAVRAGVHYPVHIINLALSITGDLQKLSESKTWHQSTK
jgi:hypothetical protein